MEIDLLEIGGFALKSTCFVLQKPGMLWALKALSFTLLCALKNHIIIEFLKDKLLTQQSLD